MQIKYTWHCMWSNPFLTTAGSGDRIFSVIWVYLCVSCDVFCSNRIHVNATFQVADERKLFLNGRLYRKAQKPNLLCV